MRPSVNPADQRPIAGGTNLRRPRTSIVKLPLVIAAVLVLFSTALAPPASAQEYVTLSASASAMTFGETVSFAGRVAGGASCIAGRAVELEWRETGSAAWAVVDTRATAGDGTFSFTDGPASSGRFRAELPPTGSCAAAASEGVAVRVGAFVDTTLVAGSLTPGSCVDLSATVLPAKPGQTVELQRRSSDGWSTIQTLVLDDASAARAEPCVGWEDVGVARLRVRWPPQDGLNAAGTGITLAIEIAQAPWMRAIDDAIGGRAVSVSVADDGTSLFGHADHTPRTPASNEKLLLSMALLDRFEPYHRIPTIAAATDVRGGVVKGNLWILGRGDPEIAPSRLRALAGRLKEAGIRAVRGRVMGATTYFRHDWWARGWKRGSTRQYVALPTALTFRHNVVNGREIHDPELRAAASLTVQLERQHVRVEGKPGAGDPPRGAAPIAEIHSRPLSGLLARMDRPSDNFFAEVLGKLLGAARSGPPGTIAKGARATEAFTDANGADFTLFDGSGLSYENRVTAEGIVALLGFADASTWGTTLRGALASGGQGTLENRLRDVRVRAKTGTLDGISALSGWVWLERDGKWIEFSILSAGMSKDTAVRIEDKIVHVLANRATTFA